VTPYHDKDTSFETTYIPGYHGILSRIISKDRTMHERS
jgi:hypothetical protein